ncbi:unnamed protein product, partial [Mesorhabditis belari]|uniref:Bestrophin homolog n=1 Tax=Mesorhabditis belari TaxID=2138241 RepID=A0AAF3EKK2_9BILA
MTVNYGLVVADASPLNRFRLLFRWKGSIWKAILAEFSLWSLCYLLLFILINFVLDVDSKNFMLMLAEKLNVVTKIDGMIFMLSFFVGAIVTRWTLALANIGFIDNLALTISYHLHGKLEKARMIRRNLIRYAIQAQLLVFRDVSTQVKKRFPSPSSMIEANFITDKELKMIDSYGDYSLPKYWMPILWAQHAIHRARNDGMFLSNNDADEIHKMFIEWRSRLSELGNMDWVPLPLVYPQLVVLVVNTYFIILLFARQPIFVGDSERDTIDLIAIILHTSLEFLFYVGWLRVAEALINPMGEDDDDFEMNWLLDRNLKTGLAIVDKGHDHVPTLEKDPHWDYEQPLLYAENTRPVNPLHGSAQENEHLNEEKNEKKISKMVPLEEPFESSFSSRRPSNAAFQSLPLKSGLSRFRELYGEISGSGLSASHQKSPTISQPHRVPSPSHSEQSKKDFSFFEDTFDELTPDQLTVSTQASVFAHYDGTSPVISRPGRTMSGTSRLEHINEEK